MSPSTPGRRRFLSLLGATTTTACATATASARPPTEAPTDDQTASEGAWPMVGADAANTGHAPHASPPTDGVRVAFQQPRARVDSPPVVADGRLWFGSNPGRLGRVDLATGAGQARAIPYTDTRFAPAVGDGTVYHGVVDSGASRLYARPVGDDDRRWESTVPRTLAGPVTYHDGELYAPCRDSVVVFDAASGSRRRTLDPATSWTGPPQIAVADDTVYWTAEDGSRVVLATDAASGERRWEYTATGTVQTQPVVADGVTYLCVRRDPENRYDLLALDAADGTETWRYTVSDQTDRDVRVPPAVADGTVYCASETRLVAVDAATGDATWTADAGAAAQPAVSDDAVYVVDSDAVRGFDRRTGTELFAATVPVDDSPALAIAHGLLFVGGAGLTALVSGSETDVSAAADGLPQTWTAAHDRRRRELAQPAWVTATPDAVFHGHWDGFVATDTATGARWTTDAGLDGEPTVAAESVYAPLGGTVAAYDTQSGDRRWQVGLDRADTVGSPRVDGSSVVVGAAREGYGGSVRRLAREDGTVQWERTFDDELSAHPALGPDHVFVLTGSTRSGEVVHALDLATGEHVWRDELRVESVAAPLVADGTLYVAQSSSVTAFDPATGAERWFVNAPAPVRGVPRYVDGRLYVVTGGSFGGPPGPGAVCGIDTAAQSLTVSVRTGAPVDASPAVLGGTVYVGTRAGTVHAVDARTGNGLGWRDLPGAVTSLAAVDGRLYVAGRGFRVTALDATGTHTEPLDPVDSAAGTTTTTPPSQTATATPGSDRGATPTTQPGSGTDDHADSATTATTTPGTVSSQTAGSEGSTTGDNGSTPGVGVLGTGLALGTGALLARWRSEGDD